MTKRLRYLLAAIGILLIAGPSPACAQSQPEMNQTAADDAAKADHELNVAYKELRATLAGDEQSQQLLDSAERAWIVFRDKQAEYEASPNLGGSIYPMVVSNVTQQLTEERTKYLRGLLKAGR